MNVANINALLEQEITTYLKQSRTYVELRSNCLAVAPVKPVVDKLSSLLDEMAAGEKAEKTHTLTHEAHRDQIIEDRVNTDLDSDRAARLAVEKQTLQSTILDHNSALVITETLYIFHQLIHSGAHEKLNRAEERVRNMEHQIRQLQLRQFDNTPSVHHELMVLLRQLQIERENVSLLHTDERREHAIYYEHTNRKSSIANEISSCQSRIQTLSTEESRIQARKTERRIRDAARSSNPDGSPRLALSDSNAHQMDNRIQAAHRKIDTDCGQMKSTGNTRCYSDFLNQLQPQIEELQLGSNEKSALITIVEKMKTHVNDLGDKQEQESALNRLQGLLEANRKQQLVANARFAALHASNKILSSRNDGLNLDLLSLRPIHEKQLDQRNFYAKCLLGVTFVIGAGALTGWFLLQAGVIALIPVLNIIAAAVILGVLAGFIIAVSIAAVRAWLTQAKISKCEQNLSDNACQIDSNMDSMQNTQGNELPRLRTELAALEQQHTAQSRVTKAAQDKAQTSYQEAAQITVNYLGQNSFFGPQPSAPPLDQVQVQVQVQDDEALMTSIP